MSGLLKSKKLDGQEPMTYTYIHVCILAVCMYIYVCIFSYNFDEVAYSHHTEIQKCTHQTYGLRLCRTVALSP